MTASAIAAALPYAQFELDPLPLRRVAAELSVTPDALTAKLGNLDPRLRALQMAEAGVDRSTLSENVRRQYVRAARQRSQPARGLPLSAEARPTRHCGSGGGTERCGE